MGFVTSGFGVQATKLNLNPRCPSSLWFAQQLPLAGQRP